MSTALRTENLSRSFGALAAVSDVSFSLPQGARHALIGPNGAGKTTFINLLAGALAPSRGDVYIGEERVTALRQHRRVKLGLTRTFQISQLFPNLTGHRVGDASGPRAHGQRREVRPRLRRVPCRDGRGDVASRAGGPGRRGGATQQPSSLRQAAAARNRARARHAAADPAARRARRRDPLDLRA
jgi:ABC-type thiamine transport system ATPase subunit